MPGCQPDKHGSSIGDYAIIDWIDLIESSNRHENSVEESTPADEGGEIKSIYKEAKPPQATYYQSTLDLLAQFVPDPFFLEIGAMDGVSFDPLYAAARKFGWRGILIEPLQDLFEKLKDNYQNDSRLVFENVAISDTYETRTIYRVPYAVVKAGQVADWAAGIASFYLNRNAIGGLGTFPQDYDRIRPFIVQEAVQCVPLQALLDRHSVERIDLVQIDTEGHDYHILKQIDLKRYKPYVVRFEARNLPSEERDAALGKLVEHGYDCYWDADDVIATRGLSSWAAHERD
jgi:FkbM family methyltransferase